MPELRVCIEVLKADIEACAKSRPHVAGVRDWQTKLTGWGRHLDKMLVGELEAAVRDVTGVRRTSMGFRRSSGGGGETGVIATGRKVPPKPGEKPLFDVDIVVNYAARRWCPFPAECQTIMRRPSSAELEGGG